MKILVDTSVVVRVMQPGSPDHRPAVDAIASLPSLGLEPCLVPQVVYELWCVVTRPVSANGLGFAVERTTLEIAQLAALLRVLRDERTIFERWQHLVTKHQVTGRLTHDARLVAAMDRHGIGRLLTLDPHDFRRFGHITVETVRSVLDA